MKARLSSPLSRRLLTSLLWISGMLTAAYAPAFGQAGNATITGTVEDASGAVVVGARVGITNTQTGVIKNSVASSTGLYLIEALIPGTYVLDISANGMRPERINNVRLDVDQQARVDVKLQVASATEAVQ